MVYDIVGNKSALGDDVLIATEEATNTDDWVPCLGFGKIVDNDPHGNTALVSVHGTLVKVTSSTQILIIHSAATQSSAGLSGAELEYVKRNAHYYGTSILGFAHYKRPDMALAQARGAEFIRDEAEKYVDHTGTYYHPWMPNGRAAYEILDKAQQDLVKHFGLRSMEQVFDLWREYGVTCWSLVPNRS